MCYINSAVNPFIFYTMSQAFKNQVKMYRIYWNSSLTNEVFFFRFRGYCGVTALKSSLVEREFHCHQLGLDQKERRKFHFLFWRNAADKLDFLNTTRGQVSNLCWRDLRCQNLSSNGAFINRLNKCSSQLNPLDFGLMLEQWELERYKAEFWNK